MEFFYFQKIDAFQPKERKKENVVIARTTTVFTSQNLI